MRSMRFQTFPLLLSALGLACGLVLSPVLAAEEEKAPEGQPAAAAAEAAEEEAPAITPKPPPEPTRIEGELIKADAEGKSITVLVAPGKGSSSRVYRRVKLTLDDNSLILVDQTPGTFANLESGQLVQVGYFDKGKSNVVDTVVIFGKKEE